MPLKKPENPELKKSLVCVIDDDDSVRRSLARLLRSANWPVETFSSAQLFLSRPTHDGPSCIVLDIRMPGLSGLELQQHLSGRGEQIVFISGHGDVPMCAQAMKAGAVDFLTKPVDGDELLGAISNAISRSSETRKNAQERAAVRKTIDTLTAREFEVMQRVITGALNKQIADDLGAAEKTIKVHRGRVMEKMGVSSVAELVRIAQLGGVQPARRLARAKNPL